MTHWLLLLCVALIVAGVAQFYVPAAFIVAGVLGVPWLLMREVEDDTSP